MTNLVTTDQAGHKMDSEMLIRNKLVSILASEQKGSSYKSLNSKSLKKKLKKMCPVTGHAFFCCQILTHRTSITNSIKLIIHSSNNLRP